MIYYTFHIDDSGAIEDIDEYTENGKTSLICKIYEDAESHSSKTRYFEDGFWSFSAWRDDN